MGYYDVWWTSEPYTLQEDNDMKGYTSTVAASVSEIICDAVFQKLAYIYA